MGKREREYDPARTLRRMRNFVVAVLLAVLAWLLLSRAYAATRADNALDELYYSTLDSRSCEALWEKGHLSPTVLASALSAYRNDRPRICIEGAYSLYGYQGKDALAPFDNNYVYLFGYQDVRSVSDGRMESLSWYIEDGSDRGHSEEYPQRCVVLRMGFSQEGLGGYPPGSNPASFDRYSATWVYDVDSKTLWLDGVYGPSGDEENGGSAFVGGDQPRRLRRMGLRAQRGRPRADDRPQPPGHPRRGPARLPGGHGALRRRGGVRAL